MPPRPFPIRRYSLETFSRLLFLAPAAALLFLQAFASPVSESPLKGKQALFLLGEHEYGTSETLPAFAKAQLEPLGIVCTFAVALSDDRQSPLCHQFNGLEKISEADVLILSTRRRYPKAEHMKAIREFIREGKPVIAIRTASHAFGSRPKGRGYQPPEGHASWDSIDVDVLGASYRAHYPDKKGEGPLAVKAWVEEAGKDHPIVSNLKDPQPLLIGNKLYKYADPDPAIKVLLSARYQDGEPAHPVAWINQKNDLRVFYTSLGSREEMAEGWVQELLKQAVIWALHDD